MKQLLLRLYHWLGRLLGELDTPRYRRETDGLPAQTRPDERPPALPISPPPTLAPPAPPPTPTLPPPPPPRLDLHNDEPARFTYKASILTKPEGRLYRTLLRAVNGRYQIMSKVRLWDFIWLENYPAERRHVLGNLSCRHVDFLLCEPYTLKPLLVIELDDRSHLKPEAQAADRFKDALFMDAGLPLLRLDQPDYSVRHLCDQIAAKLETVERDTGE
jgi:very-short-patch-repair endonuclease